MRVKQVKHGVLLLITAIIWGISFVAQSVGMDYIGPYTFTGVRCILAGIVLLPVIFVTNKWEVIEEKNNKKELLVGGVSCGVMMFLGTITQQFGLMTTTAGKSGFLTALYIIIVPIIGIALHKKAGMKLWVSVGLALIGLYMLCIQKSTGLQVGDMYTIACAFLFSIHILLIDHFAQKVNGIKMSCIQFFVCGILAISCMTLFEKPDLTYIMMAWKPIAYAGILSCGVGYTLQIVAQKGLNPTIASLIMSLESVFSAIAGWILLGESMSSTEFTGCLFVFVAIVIAQIPSKNDTEYENERIKI